MSWCEFRDRTRKGFGLFFLSASSSAGLKLPKSQIRAIMLTQCSGLKAIVASRTL
jgi:hypothetical protein